MLEYVWWILGAAIVAVVLWRFGLKVAVVAALALIGIRFVKRERELGAADERARQANDLEEVRQRHDAINRKDHSPSDAYEHLRGLRRDDD